MQAASPIAVAAPSANGSPTDFGDATLQMGAPPVAGGPIQYVSGTGPLPRSSSMVRTGIPLRTTGGQQPTAPGNMQRSDSMVRASVGGNMPRSDSMVRASGAGTLPRSDSMVRVTMTVHPPTIVPEGNLPRSDSMVRASVTMVPGNMQRSDSMVRTSAQQQAAIQSAPGIFKFTSSEVPGTMQRSSSMIRTSVQQDMLLGTMTALPQQEAPSFVPAAILQRSSSMVRTSAQQQGFLVPNPPVSDQAVPVSVPPLTVNLPMPASASTIRATMQQRVDSRMVPSVSQAPVTPRNVNSMQRAPPSVQQDPAPMQQELSSMQQEPGCVTQVSCDDNGTRTTTIYHPPHSPRKMPLPTLQQQSVPQAPHSAPEQAAKVLGVVQGQRMSRPSLQPENRYVQTSRAIMGAGNEAPSSVLLTGRSQAPPAMKQQPVRAREIYEMLSNGEVTIHG